MLLILDMRLFEYIRDHGLRAETLTDFRPGYSTVHQLFALLHCIDKTRRARQPLFAYFLDVTLKGACDRVQRPICCGR